MHRVTIITVIIYLLAPNVVYTIAGIGLHDVDERTGFAIAAKRNAQGENLSSVCVRRFYFPSGECGLQSRGY